LLDARQDINEQVYNIRVKGDSIAGMMRLILQIDQKIIINNVYRFSSLSSLRPLGKEASFDGFEASETANFECNKRMSGDSFQFDKLNAFYQSFLIFFLSEFHFQNSIYLSILALKKSELVGATD
jgi:hypothetical protein